jgi:hypothetical protein
MQLGEMITGLQRVTKPTGRYARDDRVGNDAYFDRAMLDAFAHDSFCFGHRFVQFGCIDQ